MEILFTLCEISSKDTITPPFGFESEYTGILKVSVLPGATIEIIVAFITFETIDFE
ncbi:hypothetical protein D3C75_465920 [compost metagenome]